MLVDELLGNCCSVTSVIVTPVFAVEGLIEANQFQKCKRNVFRELRRMLSILQAFLDGGLFFYPDSPPVCCCAAVLVCALMLQEPVGGRSFTEPRWDLLLCLVYEPSSLVLHA